MNYMMQNYGFGFGSGLLLWLPGFFLLLMVWSLFWKGLSLWHAAGRKQGWWFVVLLLLNTAGILDIIYLFAVAKVPTNELFNAKK